MLSDEEIDLRALNYRALAPADREAFKREVIRRAHAERDAVIRAALRGLWSSLLTGAAVLHYLWAAYRKRRERRIGMDELFALDDNMLKDMGISRSEIIAAVYAEHSSRLPPTMTPVSARDRVTACVSQSSARAQQVSISPI
jgi:uncharacterized protein YjiS (DUF1127 family)